LHTLTGVLPALVTPVDAAGVFYAPSYEQLLDRVYTAGVNGVYVCGQTGEGFQLSLSDRQRAAECAVHNTPKKSSVVVHVGALTTADSVTLTKHAGRCGAHMVSSLPPLGNYSFEEIREYYKAIASASELPLLIYYFPSLSPTIRTTEQILELCAIPNVVGLKFTDSDFFRMWQIRQSGSLVFAGSDEMLLAGLIMGANGGIGSTYNLMSPQFVRLFELTSSQRWEEARVLQGQINELIAVLVRYPIHSVIKQVLAWTGIDCGSCIAPRRQLTDSEQNALREAMSRTSLGAEVLSQATIKA
jgi:N-acetylneuraminate lyase